MHLAADIGQKVLPPAFKFDRARRPLRIHELAIQARELEELGFDDSAE